MKSKKILGIVLIIVSILLLLAYVYKYVENYRSNSREDDSYINIWNKRLFVKANDIDINYIITYHNFPYYDKSVNIMLDGEPMDVTRVKTDVIITTKKEKLPSIPSVYIPYFAFSFIVNPTINPAMIIKKQSESKDKFCCFMYSNCDEKFEGVVNRRKFLELMNQMTGNRVDNLGKCYNPGYKNDNNEWHTWSYNYEKYRPYKFVIAFENSELKGYISEKLVQPMLAHSIPIYLGASDVGEYFNTKSFINVKDFPDFKTCIEYVIKVDRDDALYNSIISEPYLRSDRDITDIFSIYYGGRVYKELYRVFKPFGLSKFLRPCYFYTNNIRFVTFADETIYKAERIVEEADTSGFFKEVKAFSPRDFDDEFKVRHESFIHNNKRGYGYWIWKPYIILKNLNEMKYGDFLVWSDSGTTINYKGYTRMKELYNLLETKDIITFKIKYNEIDWSKMDSVMEILKLFNKTQIDFNQSIEDNQYQNCSGFLLVKKTFNSVRMVETWYNLCCNYHLVDDTPSILPNMPNFKEHRHDQTILSLLTRFTPSVAIVDDNYEDSLTETTTPDGKQKVFIASRKK